MKKKIFSLFLIVCMLIASSTIVFAMDGNQSMGFEMDEDPMYVTSDAEDQEVLVILNNIENEEVKEKLFRLLSVSAYTKTEKNNEITRPTIAELVSHVKNLSKLSPAELDLYIESVILTTIEKEKNSDNVIWSEEFIGNEVRKYVPQHREELEKQNEENIIKMQESLCLKTDYSVNRGFTPGTMTTPTNTVTSYVYDVLSGQNLRLASVYLKVQFSWDGTGKVYSLYPTTTFTMHTSFVAFDKWIESTERLEYDYFGYVKKVIRFKSVGYGWPPSVITNYCQLGKGSLYVFGGGYYLD